MKTLSSFNRLTGEAFQKFCCVLLSRHLPHFLAVNGAGGDSGNDGFFASGDTIFQMYAPPKPTLDKLRKKIDDSLQKVVDLRKTQMPKIETLIFVTPDDLTHDGLIYLLQRAENAGLKALSWGESKLTAILSQHPDVKSMFPDLFLPDVISELRAASTRSGAHTEEDDAYRKWLAGIRPVVLQHPHHNIILNVDDPSVEFAFRARKEGDLEVEVIGSDVILLPPGAKRWNVS